MKRITSVELSRRTLLAAGAGSLVGVLASGAPASATPSRLPASLDEYLVPEDFGANVNASDNSEELQAALDASASTGVFLLMDNDYETKRPLYLPAGVRWCGSGRVTNTLGNSGKFSVTVMPGNYHPVYWSQLDYSAGGAVTANDTYMVLQTPSDALDYAVGDLVFICSDAHTTRVTANNTQVHPHYGSMNRVTAVNATTGRIDFEFPWLRDVSATKIAHADNSIVDFHGTRTLYCAYDLIVDGISLESVNGTPLERGSALGSSLHWAELKGLNGIFGNSYCFSDVTIDNIVVDRKILDVAGSSLGSTFTIDTATYTKSVRSEQIALLALNESLHDLTINFTTIAATDYDFSGGQMMQISRATGVDVNIGAMTSTALVGPVISFVNQLDTTVGDTQFVSRDNSVTIGTFTGSSTMLVFARYLNYGGQLLRCDLDGDFTGNPTSYAIDFAGSGHTIRGSYSSGDINLGSATNMDVDIDLGAGTVIGSPSTGSNSVTVNGVIVP